MNDANGSCLLLCWQSDLCSVLNMAGAAALKLCHIPRQKTFSLWKTLENVGELCQQIFFNCFAIRSIIHSLQAREQN
jgi:hypothetical protein